MSSINRSLATRSSSLRLRLKTLILFILAVILGFLTIFPLLWMFSSSLKGPDEVNGTALIPQAPTLVNFIYVFTQVPFLGYMLNSFVVAITVTIVALLFHSMAAYALAWLKFPGRDMIFLLIFSTFLVSLPIILVPLFMLVKFLGWLNSFAGLIVPAIFNAFGIFLLRQFYLSIPGELGEAAIIDGCGHWRVYWHLILPLSKPIMAALAVFFFLANWNSFLWPLTITSDQSLWMVQIGIASFQTQYSAAWNYIMAASTIAALPTLILFFVFQRQLVQSIKSTGFK
ncbi:MAG TPA: carbohydrate ABC transporter permease [Ktedonobacteraceae bacterium]|nr:carbohydrate ABC transporter permease [Ktedonobacteraceae bacterium]